MKQMQIAKQFKYLTIQIYKLLLQYIHHIINIFLMNPFITDRLVAYTAIEAVPH
jgi:hypothetical protein